MEKIRVIIVSDKEKVGLRPKLKSEIEQNNNLEVVLLSRLKISRIRGEIVPLKPTLLFITASLYTAEEFNELQGFVKKLKKHLAQASIVVHTPKLRDFKIKEIFEVGADVWIDEKLDYSFLGGVLEAIIKNEVIFHPLQVIRKQEAS